MSLPVAILAGGLGTRMRPHTERIPKVLLEVAGEPFAVHQIKLLARHGVRRIVFCVGCMGDQVQAALGDGQRWGVHLDYIFDGPTLLGTGGALRNALPKLGGSFFVLYGDSYLDCDFAAVGKAFLSSGKLGLMTVVRNKNRWDTSNVVLASGVIVRYDKRNLSPEMEHIDYGLGLLRANVFDAYPPNSSFDLVAVYQDLIAKGQLAGYEMSSRFYEIGSPAGLEETRRLLESGQVGLLQ